MSTEKVLPLNEIYSCLQGEGKFAGVPHLLIRFTGCPLRCQFSETDFCDTHYSSWAPEKGKYTGLDIWKLMKDNSHIRYTMITGGSPTMHPEVLKDLCSMLRLRGHYITIETEGSSFVRTEAQFISLSPKLQSSIPKIGTIMPWNERQVSQLHVNSHERSRKNYSDMERLIKEHADYQVKFVVSQVEDLEEIETIEKILGVEREKIYLMPAGMNNTELNLRRKMVMGIALREGYNYTDRLHIIAYDNLRGV